MEIVMISLLAFSLILLIISLLQRDSVSDIKDELDQFTMQQLQDMYQLKRKIKVLEEELLVSDDSGYHKTPKLHQANTDIHEIIKNQVWALAQQGKPIDQISKQSSLSPETVYSILQEYAAKGKKDE